MRRKQGRGVKELLLSVTAITEVKWSASQVFTVLFLLKQRNGVKERVYKTAKFPLGTVWSVSCGEMAVDQRSVSDSVAQQPCLLVFFVILSPKISSGANIISKKKNVRAWEQACFCENGLRCWLDASLLRVYCHITPLSRCLRLLNVKRPTKMR